MRTASTVRPSLAIRPVEEVGSHFLISVSRVGLGFHLHDLAFLQDQVNQEQEGSGGRHVNRRRRSALTKVVDQLTDQGRRGRFTEDVLEEAHEPGRQPNGVVWHGFVDH